MLDGERRLAKRPRGNTRGGAPVFTGCFRRGLGYPPPPQLVEESELRGNAWLGWRALPSELTRSTRAGQELPKEARLTLKESLRVERLFEVEEGEVEVMADLVEQGSQEGAVRDGLSATRGAHPDEDAGLTVRLRVVEPVQLLPGRAGALREHPDLGRGDAELVAERSNEALRAAIDLDSIVGGERGADRVREGHQRGRIVELDPVVLVAAPIDGALSSTQAPVVVESHRRRFTRLSGPGVQGKGERRFAGTISGLRASESWTNRAP